VTYGNASGPVPPFSALDLLKAGSAFVTRPTLSDYMLTSEEMRTSATRLFEMIESGGLEIMAGTTFPLTDAADAHRAMEGRSTSGSVVLIP
jgi:NADPH2:quinone reductase